MDLLNQETHFKYICPKVYRKIREANHRSLSFQNEYNFARPIRFEEKMLLEIHIFSFGKPQNCANTEVDRKLWLK